MKIIIQYIGYFMAVVGLVTFFVGRAERRLSDQYSIRELQKQIAEINKQTVTKNEIVSAVDSIFSIRINPVVESQNALRTSYTKFLRRTDWLTKDDFLELMEGIQFSLKYDSLTYKPNIIIRKIK